MKFKDIVICIVTFPVFISFFIFLIILLFPLVFSVFAEGFEAKNWEKMGAIGAFALFGWWTFLFMFVEIIKRFFF